MSQAAGILDQASPQVTEQPTTEAAPAVEKTPDRMSGKMEILIKREQAAMAREKAAKDKEAELEQKLARIRDFESVKTNPKKALELLDMDYDTLTKSILSDGEVPIDTKLKAIEDKFSKFIETQEQEKARLAEEAKAKTQEQEQKMITDFKGEINKYIKENVNDCELIQFEEQNELVYDVIDEHYKRTINPETGVGEVMSIKDAAAKVEAHLEQKYEKAKELSKIKAKWGSAVPKGTLLDAFKQTNQFTQKPKTLTNNLSATQQAPRMKPLTDDERVAKAIAYARGLRP